MQSIAPHEISVVVQGPLYLGATPSIYDCLASIRQHLPEAEIVVSTWRSEPDLALPGVRMIRSGSVPPMIDIDGRPINTRRQRLSTLRGIEAATRPFVLKFRADHRLLDSRIARLGHYEAGPLAKYRLFTSPITTTTMFFRDPCAAPMLFHPSDLVQFGRRKDLLSFWSAPPIAVSEYFLPRPRANPFGNCIRFTARRYVPEQELMIAFLRSRGYDVALTSVCHFDFRLMRLSESALLENFVALDWRHSGIEFPLRLQKRASRQKTDYSAVRIERTRRLITTRWYLLRSIMALANKYATSTFTRKWWRWSLSLLLLRSPRYLAKRRKRNFQRYGLSPSDVTANNSPRWRISLSKVPRT